MNINKEVAVADATVGTNLLSDEAMARTGYERMLTGIGLVGSAAFGDTEVDIIVGSMVVFTIANSALGLGVTRSNILGTRVRVPAGQAMEARVIDQPATNPIRIYLHLLP